MRAAHRDEPLKQPRPEEWLLIEWPEDEAEPTKYWLSSLPEDIPCAELVDLTKLRWRIERDYQELKQELGLGHYEGRGWRGFHHHASLCIAAYGLLISERETIPPQDQVPPRSSRNLQFSSSFLPYCRRGPLRGRARRFDSGPANDGCRRKGVIRRVAVNGPVSALLFCRWFCRCFPAVLFAVFHTRNRGISITCP